MAAPFKLDDNLLHELGLGTLPVDEKNRMLAHIYETLEMRVGMRLAEQMSDAQLDEFESYINRGDEAGALKWLESNFPNYKDVVAEELEKLKNEVRAVAPQILAQSQAAAAQSQAPIPNPNMAPPVPGQFGGPSQQMPPTGFPPAPSAPSSPPAPGYQAPPTPFPGSGPSQMPSMPPQAPPPQPQYPQPPQYPGMPGAQPPQPQSQPPYPPQQPYSPPVPPMPFSPPNDPGTYQPPQQSTYS